ncbi:hypothetical protein [Kribbella sp. HUAS MG21]|uniref:Uncharacterized protein n=1 Tax=Kribbella sp. HUAS MG21 TaxID=3160966 RepID=A0AAU7T680_9ACTN
MSLCSDGDGQQRRRPHEIGGDHDGPSPHPVEPGTDRQSEEHERQREGGLQQRGARGARTQRGHRAVSGIATCPI